MDQSLSLQGVQNKLNRPNARQRRDTFFSPAVTIQILVSYKAFFARIPVLCLLNGVTRQRQITAHT